MAGKIHLLQFPCFLCLLILLTQYCTANDTLTQLQQLYVNQTLVSADETFELGFFSPGNSKNLYVGMWYKNIPVRRILWVANREKPLDANDSASRLMIGIDGNLRLVDGEEERSVWSTNVSIKSSNHRSIVAVLTEKGQLVLKDSVSGLVFWDSQNHPGDTVAAGTGMNQLGYDSRTGTKQQLLSWKAENDPSPGEFTLGLSEETPPQAFVWTDNSRPYWRGGPWNGMQFIGIPDEDPGYSNWISLVQNNQQGTTYVSFNTFNMSYVQLFTVRPSGLVQVIDWDSGQNAWTLNWQAPDHFCDVYGACGPFGVCNKHKKSQPCECLKGFVPNSTEEWGKGNWTGGCLRRTELMCHQNETDTEERSKDDIFFRLSEMKLPDGFLYLYGQDNLVCEKWCRDECSCVAYAYPQSIGCMVWTSGLVDIQQFSNAGEDLYLRLAYSEVDNWKAKLIVGFISVTSAILVCILIYTFCRLSFSHRETRKRASSEKGMTGVEVQESHALLRDSSELPMFGFDELVAATSNFSDDNKLGAGGFGPVYKGVLTDGMEVAVKRLSSFSGQGTEEFKNEILVISKLQHRNLVRLLGCSIHGEEKLLVYEHMKNKSLDHLLFDPTKKEQLDWAKRFNIIQGIARGLLYLHRDSCLRIIHRDLKASNILLDKDMNPKISDFGLARPFRVTEELANTHRVVGTFGYMSPEYVMRGLFSEKSDVYSFGVLLLEIVSGKKNSGGFHNHDEHFSLHSYAWKLWIESREVDLIDESVANSCCFTEALRCIRIGLLCVQDHASDRPTMSNVVLMLSSETDIPQPKQPTFTFQGLWDSDSKSNSSKNEATVSVTEVR